jgi:hypothetical protein
MKKVVVLTVIIMLMLFRCEKRHFEKEYRNYEKFTGFPQEETWEFKKIPGISFFTPRRFILLDNQYFIFIADTDGEILQIYDIDSGENIKSFGKKGQGPGEFVGASIVSPSPSNPKEFWIYDVTLRRLTKYNIETVLNSTDIKPDYIVNICADAGQPFNFSFLSDNTFIASGAFQSRLCFYNLNGDTIKTNGYVPGKRDHNVTIFEHLVVAYQCALNFNHRKKKIAICNYDGDLLEIYDIKGNIIKTVHGPDLFIPEYIPYSGHAKMTSQRCGYTDLCSSSNYIYCVYSGERQENMQDWLVGCGKNILIFNWQGEPVKQVKTDIRLGPINFSEERNTIYAICYDGAEFYIGYHKL